MSIFPFSAAVGLDDLRLALLLNAVSPAIGGVLVRGEKGTAKSTVVRALASLLPSIDVIEGCRFSCDPAAPYASCPDGPHNSFTNGGAGASDAIGSATSVAASATSAGASDPSVAASATSAGGAAASAGGAAASAGGAAASVVTSRKARLVELPVGATEDRLVGALDLERALTAGQAWYEPGLLAGAHRGVLYVDEVNLLHDHLVDLLLDAAAMGEAYVERDSVSVRHAARFLLVGTMNPEEGELRPQLLDRFGLAVEVRAPLDTALRVEVVRRRLAYENDASAFAAKWASADAVLAERITNARKRLPMVQLPDAELTRIAHVCATFEVDGMRADIVVARTAMALAAWHDRTIVLAEDVRTAARLALPHRRRRNPFDAPDLDERALDDALNSAPPPAQDTSTDAADGSDQARDGDSDADRDGARDREPHDGSPPERGLDGWPDNGGPENLGPDGQDDGNPNDGPDDGPSDGGPDNSNDDGPDDEPPSPGGGRGGQAGEGERKGSRESTQQAAEPQRAKLFSVPGVGAGASGRRSPAYTRSGRTVKAQRPKVTLSSLHLAATVRAAAPHQIARGRTGKLVLHKQDLREPVRQGRESNLVLFCVDASGSMAARQRMSAVKGAVLSLLLDAYQRRDKVGLVTFRGTDAELTLPPTSSVEAGAARLRQLPTGGRTPLAQGLHKAAETLRIERLRDPQRRALLIVVTDGRATSASTTRAVQEAMAVARRIAAANNIACIVIDCESGVVRLGLAAKLATALNAEHLPLSELTANGLAGIARSERKAA
jgi:magnesium chelatase subunit D